MGPTVSYMCLVLYLCFLWLLAHMNELKNSFQKLVESTAVLAHEGHRSSRCLPTCLALALGSGLPAPGLLSLFCPKMESPAVTPAAQQCDMPFAMELFCLLPLLLAHKTAL